MPPPTGSFPPTKAKRTSFLNPHRPHRRHRRHPLRPDRATVVASDDDVLDSVRDVAAAGDNVVAGANGDIADDAGVRVVVAFYTPPCRLATRFSVSSRESVRRRHCNPASCLLLSNDLHRSLDDDDDDAASCDEKDVRSVGDRPRDPNRLHRRDPSRVAGARLSRVSLALKIIRKIIYKFVN